MRFKQFLGRWKVDGWIITDFAKQRNLQPLCLQRGIRIRNMLVWSTEPQKGTGITSMRNPRKQRGALYTGGSGDTGGPQLLSTHPSCTPARYVTDGLWRNGARESTNLKTSMTKEGAVRHYSGNRDDEVKVQVYIPNGRPLNPPSTGLSECWSPSLYPLSGGLEYPQVRKKKIEKIRM